jgi:hypothetical protein
VEVLRLLWRCGSCCRGVKAAVEVSRLLLRRETAVEVLGRRRNVEAAVEA